MLKRNAHRGPVELSGEVFGVGVTLAASDHKLMDMLSAWLPPGWREGQSGVNPISLTVVRSGPEEYQVARAGETVGAWPLEDAIRTFEVSLRNHIATSAPAHIFIHAGTVARNGRAIVIPGPSFSGKTTLVTALVQAGAMYYSDEYAVLDADGLVYPYPKPISIRTGAPDRRRSNHRASSLGGTVGTGPAPIGLVVCTQYRTAARWEPQQLTPAQAALELLKCSFQGENRAREALATLGKAVTGVAALKGDRGDAATVVPDLLARLGP
ncbi:MAG: hypothetical protein ACRDL8_04415 [Solirubrobacteraceae bacterium]